MWALKEGLNAFNSEIHNDRPSSSSKVISKTNIIWYHLYVESKIRQKWTYLQTERLTEKRGQGWMDQEF